jgi:RNA-directed DNA polymerase
VVDIDLEKFFDRVNHDILMARLAKRIEDKRLLRIIRRFLKAGILQEGVGVVREQGVMQGGPLSPLLSNILLDELDKELERRGHLFCRYADDCNIYVKSLKAGARVLSSITGWLETRLKLRVNEAKSDVAPVDLRQFLGYRLRSTGELDLPKKSEARLRATIRQVTKRNRGVSFAQVIRELNEKLRGWSQYFKWLERPAQLATLDSWIRRKLRCYRLKQWKNSQTIKANLIQLGVKPRNARETSSSGKGWWRLSRTPALHKGLSNRWFEEQGLLNLRNQITWLQGIT